MHEPGLLLERDDELSLLCGRIAALRRAAGQGACVLVHGEAGVGKTSLLREATARCGDDVLWLRGGCEPLLSAPPLGALLDLLAQLPPSLAAAVRGGQPQVPAALLEFLRERARPAVLVIDDAQWADGATLDLLRYIGRRIEDTRALLVIAHRDEGVGADHPLRVVLGGLPPRSTLRLPLRPLSADAVAQLAQRAGRDARGLHEATGGNPFFVTELLAGQAQAHLPAAVRDAVLARAAPLSAAARDMLALVSVAPAGLEAAVAHAAAASGAAAIDECCVAGLLQLDAAMLHFRHELARQSIEFALPAVRAAALHKQVFDALVARGAAPARLVHHAQNAGLTADVLRLAPLAARAATQMGAHRQAAALLRLALDHAADIGLAARAVLWCRLAEASLAAQRLDDAFDGWKHALLLHRQGGDTLGEGIALRQMARIEWLRGAIPRGIDTARSAIALLQGIDAPRELAMAQATLAQLHMLHECPAVAIDAGLEALRVFEALDDAEGLAHALSTVGFAELIRGGGATSWARVERSLRIAHDNQFGEAVSRAYVNLASLSLVHRRLGPLHAWCAEGIAWCEARDLDMSVARLRLRDACGRIHGGQWAPARAALVAVRAMPQLTPLEAEQSAHLLALLDLREGDDAADAYWSALIDGRRRLSIDPWYAPQAVACCEAAWQRGDNATLERIGLPALHSALRSGERWRIGQIACWLQRVGRLPTGFNAEVAPPCALELAGDLAGAAAAWAALGCRHEQALVLAGGDAALLREALALFTQLGAAPAARIVRRRLRALGERAGARGPQARTRDNAHGLTARERVVLDLLSERLSNRAIAERLHRSERTIEHHVSALLAKLGSASRDAAVAAVRQEN